MVARRNVFSDDLKVSESQVFPLSGKRKRCLLNHNIEEISLYNAVFDRILSNYHLLFNLFKSLNGFQFQSKMKTWECLK